MCNTKKIRDIELDETKFFCFFISKGNNSGSSNKLQLVQVLLMMHDNIIEEIIYQELLNRTEKKIKKLSISSSEA